MEGEMESNKTITLFNDNEWNYWLRTFNDKEEFMKFEESLCKFPYNKKLCDIIVKFFENYKNRQEDLLNTRPISITDPLRFILSANRGRVEPIILTQKDQGLLNKLSDDELQKLLKILDGFEIVFLIEKVSLYLVERFINKLEFCLEEYSIYTQNVLKVCFEQKRSKIDGLHQCLFFNFTNLLSDSYYILKENKKLKKENYILKNNNQFRKLRKRKRESK